MQSDARGEEGFSKVLAQRNLAVYFEAFFVRERRGRLGVSFASYSIAKDSQAGNTSVFQHHGNDNAFHV